MRRLSLIILVFVIGCKVKDTHVDRFPVRRAVGNTAQLQFFPKKNIAAEPWKFGMNRFFLWHENFDGQQVEKVLEQLVVSNGIDAQGEELGRLLELAINEAKPVENAIRSIRKKIKKKEKRIKSIDEKLADETLGPEKIAALEAERNEITDEIEQLENDWDAKKLELEPLQAKISEVEEVQAQNAADLDASLQKMKEVTLWFEKPPKPLIIRLVNDEFEIEVQNFDPKDGGGPRSFTSMAGDIDQIRYIPLGGTIEFTVHTGPKTEFRFKGSRAQIETGKVILSGEVQRISPEDKLPRAGVIKFKP